MKLLNAFLFITFVLSISFAHDSDSHECQHDNVQQDLQFLDVEEDMGPSDEEERERLLATATYNNIRIYPYYAPLATSSPVAFKNYAQLELIPPVIDYFQAALKVKYPVVGKLTISKSVKTICGLATPSILTTTGVTTDYFYFFDSEYNEESWVAQSSFCYLTAKSRRPLVAKTRFNRQLIKIANGDPLIHERNTYLLMHEMIHTFGFSSSIFPYFITSTGAPLTGHIKSVVLQGTTRTVINVPVLTNKLRTFFGCSSTPGAFMENNGGSGTAGSHFERRHFVYETMTSGVINGRRMSQFSFAMLEASGWYIPNYNYTEPYYFGQGQGCTFLTGSCSSSTFNFAEFCKGTGRGCTDVGRGGGICATDAKADGCRYMFPDISLDCENPNAGASARLSELQVFGRYSNSKCFTGTLTSSKSTGTSTNWCFKYTCSGSGTNTVLNVQVGSRKLTCTKESKIAITGYNGYIDCPDPLTFCNTVGKNYCPRGCMGRGTCKNNVCVCKKGYTGIDCGLLL